jgi:hypothetical protein
MPEHGTIPLDVPPGEGQLEIFRCNDKKAVASVAGCGDEEEGVPHLSGDGNRRGWKRLAWWRAVSWTEIEVR